MKKFLAVSLLLSLALAQGPTPAPPIPIRDVPNGHWAKESITQLTKLGIIAAYPDNTFRGENPITRYELAVVLYRAYTQWLGSMTAQIENRLSNLRQNTSASSTAAAERNVSASEISKLKDEMLVLAAQISNLKTGFEALRSTAEALRNNLDPNLERSNVNITDKDGKPVEDTASISQTLETVTLLRDSLQNLATRVARLEEAGNQLNRLGNNLSDNSAILAQLEQFRIRQNQVFENLKVILDEQAVTLGEQNKVISEFKGYIDSEIAANRRTIEQALASTNNRISALERTVASLAQEQVQIKEDIEEIKERLETSPSKITLSVGGGMTGPSLGGLFLRGFASVGNLILIGDAGKITGSIENFAVDVGLGEKGVEGRFGLQLPLGGINPVVHFGYGEGRLQIGGGLEVNFDTLQARGHYTMRPTSSEQMLSGEVALILPNTQGATIIRALGSRYTGTYSATAIGGGLQYVQEGDLELNLRAQYRYLNTTLGNGHNLGGAARIGIGPLYAEGGINYTTVGGVSWGFLSNDGLFTERIYNTGSKLKFFFGIGYRFSF